MTISKTWWNIWKVF